eukprot:SAG11_NODE_3056_length_2724_cov_4.133333_5_plen_78_part_00
MLAASSWSSDCVYPNAPRTRAWSQALGLNEGPVTSARRPLTVAYLDSENAVWRLCLVEARKVEATVYAALLRRQSGY